jgi:hypothetical protein
MLFVMPTSFVFRLFIFLFLIILGDEEVVSFIKFNFDFLVRGLKEVLGNFELLLEIDPICGVVLLVVSSLEFI